LTADGTVAWQKTYGGVDGDSASSMVETSDGGFVVAGTTVSFGAGDRDVWILKLARDGTIVWQKTYGESGRDSATSIVETSDGGFVVAGISYSFDPGGTNDVWVIKLNSDGAVAWQKTYDWGVLEAVGSIQKAGDGGFVLAGHLWLTDDRPDALVFKVDSMGDIPDCNVIGISNAVVSDTAVVGQSTSATVQPSAAAVTVTSVIPQDGAFEASLECPDTGRR
jgi:hypothetical protein